MAIETLETGLYPLVRQLLGDTDVAGGDLFTNSEIQPLFVSAWDELIGMMSQDQIPTAKRTAYHVVPAYTNVLFPSQMNILDLTQWTPSMSVQPFRQCRSYRLT